MKYFKIILFFLLSFNIYAQDINFDDITTLANNQNKQVMVFFHMKHCPWCHQMIDESINDKSIIKIIKKYFIYTSIDIETSGDVLYQGKTISKIDFARKFNIYFYPTTLMFNNKEIVENIKGYRNKNKYTNIIKYIGSHSQYKMTLKEFIAELDFQNDDT
jgi:thioredoxin-related protein